MIRYSRHAKRRMKLYKINQNDVEEAIKVGVKKLDGERNIMFLYNLADRKFPLKIVSKLLGNDYLVITCYFLKKGIK